MVPTEASTKASRIEATPLAASVKGDLEKQLGVTLDSSMCTDGVDATIGSTTTCTVTLGQQTLTVRVTVSGVSAGRIDYGIDKV